MSAPSISTVEGPHLLTVVPGVQVSATGELQVDGRWLGKLGAVPGEFPPGMVLTESLAAGPRWFLEQVVVEGQCVLLRLRPRPGPWRRWWSSWRGEPAAHEVAVAARWGLLPRQAFPWGVLEGGVDPALRGAAVITLRATALPQALPPAAPVFWRRRTQAECRAHVASACAIARAEGDWCWGSHGLVFADGSRISAHPEATEPAECLPPDFLWQEGLDGAWRVRGERAGWRFTLGYREMAGRPVLGWLLARLAVADEGPWDPLLEAELHRAHQRWLRGIQRRSGAMPRGPDEPVCTAVAVNDSVARTGAEVLLEWRLPAPE